MKISHVGAVLAVLSLSLANATMAAGPIKGAVVKGGQNPPLPPSAYIKSSGAASASGDSGSIPADQVASSASTSSAPSKACLKTKSKSNQCNE